MPATAFGGGSMNIASEILSLRRNQLSSVEALIAALEWRRSLSEDTHIAMRDYAVAECADSVLLNVAVHALAAQDEFTSLGTEPNKKKRARRLTPTRQHPRRPRISLPSLLTRVIYRCISVLT
jgi:hypothetical protein